MAHDRRIPLRMPLVPLALCLFVSTFGCGGRRDATRQARASDTITVTSSDPLVRAAADTLRAGRPYRATQLLAPVLADSSRRTPEAVLVAALAAAGWEGWSEVERLLRGAAWADSLFGGRARLLLARAALERHDDAAALADAHAAVEHAPDDAERARRTVFLARALDRLDRNDSAAAAYAVAASGLSSIGDWLRLRAAGVEPDTARRARMYGALTLAAARARIAPTEAAALERARDFPAAARAYAALGRQLPALRLRLLADSSAASRALVRQQLLQFIAGGAQGDTRSAIELLDRNFPTLAPDEELVVGRAAGPAIAARAVRGFERGAPVASLRPEDRLDYAQALARVGRGRDAIAQLALVTTPAPLAAAATYRRARLLLVAGDRAGATAALESMRQKFPADTSTALALSLLADFAVDDERESGARALLAEVVRRFPSFRLAPSALFRGAISLLAAGESRAAAVALDSIDRLYPRAEDAEASRYWAGRAWSKAGDAAAARARWSAAADRDSLSYYAALASARLGVPAWTPARAGDAAVHVADVDSAAARAALLDELGMDVESRLELDEMTRAAGRDTLRLLAVGAALLRAGETSRAIEIGWRLVAVGIRDARAYRLAYPLVGGDVLRSEAAARSLDPALVAAVIRQESSFNPKATSPVGARGLMQVMPEVGRQIARARGITPWDPVLLYQPDVSIQLGVDHLATFIKQFGVLPRVLAAYNAGPARVPAWAKRPGAEDPELFAERIPFAETRDYVRIVQRNRDLYRALYDLPATR